MVISLQPLCRRKQRVTEVHCQVGMRAEVKYGLLATYEEDIAIKREQQELCPKKAQLFSVWRAWSV